MRNPTPPREPLRHMQVGQKSASILQAPPPPLHKHRVVQAPGPGLTVSFTEFSDHGFYGQKLGKA